MSWNKRYGAPAGRTLRGDRILGQTSAGILWKGPFAWQPNNSTREFEFPWAHEQIATRGRAQQILEVGGGLAGLQFVLARKGHEVTNVDPGVTPPLLAASSGGDFSISAVQHERLCKTFRAPVRLVSTTIADADFAAESFDIVLSVSAIEHFNEESLAELVEHVQRVLRPDGLAIFTVDLFLNIHPFTSRRANRMGQNVDVRELLQNANLRLESGTEGDLFGFEGFDAERIQQRLSEYHVGYYPSLSQCFTARRIS
jgi:SAM-dependent methyltransferase